MQTRKLFIAPMALAAIISFAGGAHAESFTLSGDGFRSFGGTSNKVDSNQIIVGKCKGITIYALRKYVNKVVGKTVKVVAMREGFPTLCYLNP